MRTPLILFTFLLSLTLISCTSVIERIPGVYSLDIQQGNIITQDMIDQLRPNMNKRQVLYIMGSPMLKDIFHQKRWDYLYSEQPGGEARLQKRISLFFDGDVLIGVQGDFRPSNVPVVTFSKDTTVDVPKRDLEKTLFQKIGSIFSSEDDVTVAETVKKIETDDEVGAEEIEEISENEITEETDEKVQDTPIDELEESVDVETLDETTKIESDEPVEVETLDETTGIELEELNKEETSE